MSRWAHLQPCLLSAVYLQLRLRGFGEAPMTPTVLPGPAAHSGLSRGAACLPRAGGPRARDCHFPVIPMVLASGRVISEGLQTRLLRTGFSN